MITKWEAGYDDVYAKRKPRGKKPWLRKQFPLLFYEMDSLDILITASNNRMSVYRNK